MYHIFGVQIYQGAQDVPQDHGNMRFVEAPLPRVIRAALLSALVTAAATLGLALTGLGGVWALTVALGIFFVTFGLVAANATTLALQPHGAIAGSAAAALGFAQTVIPALIASVVALAYDGTAVPMLVAILLLSLMGWLLAAVARAGRG